ncbi:MAG TPA: hypothetical protein VMV77_12760 [Bacteroidales bacterium]|nr:hypothetical protein [archaeon]HUX57841.1 hypothetical protein [Bacteroidales bacterium]
MRWIVLTPEQAERYRQYKITPWWGIDPIQIKDGRWVLREDQIGELEGFKQTLTADAILQKIAVPIAELDKADEPIIELKTIKTIVELTKDDFPEPDIEEKPIIKKL